MLILLRQNPDERLREVISSVVSKEPASHLVYLEHALAGHRTGTDPFFISGITCSLENLPSPAIRKIESSELLGLIRKNPGILVLP